MKKVLITGIAGQDGSYLAEFLLDKDYEVYGIEKPGFTLNAYISNRIKCCYEIDITKPNLLKKSSGKLFQMKFTIWPRIIFHHKTKKIKKNHSGNFT